ncbi:TetR/AcrR family transcriptional regulator [Mesoterricola silvestris]|uniref:TetR family transcriptional regulator n=1 Tax=Mesoterricola silvestris TaxID=2927979 RepID=A0AA48GPE9_9BACT|nr:TetR/AcrR family transcriptional regulator [Mesoterricola silvestris]BDU73679.1 TetR family transcriptional regulator [Mesoterricola silvestris]
MKTESRGRPGTEERLVAAAVTLFSRKWYGTVSVAEICRAAGLSNGVFYRYFTTKEALFKVILGRVLDQIREAVEGVRGETPRERVRNFAETIIRFSEEHPDLISVFREGQYRHIEYERRLGLIYIHALGSSLGGEIGVPEYLFALGGLRFCAIARAFGHAPVDIPSTCDILTDGIFRGQAFDPAKVFGGTASPLPLPLEESARDRLLRSGRRLFGEKGFFETNIHEITGNADLSVGAFYTYFESKETFYAELIERVGHDVRAFISRNLANPDAGPPNALELELRGLWLWVVYLSIDKWCYNIVREAEFILPQAVRQYYGAFAAGYRKRPPHLRVGATAPGVDEGTAIEYLMGVAHYLGIKTAFDESATNARLLVEGLGGYLSRGLSDFLA